LDIPSAWRKLGFDFVSIMSELASLPRKERVSRAREMLDSAKKKARSLMGKYHPDRGGDEAEFRAVADALQTIEDATDDFEKKMSRFVSDSETAASKKVFIVKD
jgi:thiamine biosynthesis lipoprotein ApbE